MNNEEHLSKTPKEKRDHEDNIDIIGILLSLIYCIVGLVFSFASFTPNLGSNILAFLFPLVFTAIMLQSNYDKKSVIVLRAEKDQYMIWSAAGSLFLVFLQHNKNLPWELIATDAFYGLWLIGIQYRRLCEALYQKEAEEKEIPKYCIQIERKRDSPHNKHPSDQNLQNAPSNR